MTTVNLVSDPSGSRNSIDGVSEPELPEEMNTTFTRF